MYPRILQKFDNYLISLIGKYANYRWYHSPLAKRPLATAQEYMSIAEKARQKEYPIVSTFEHECKFAIDTEWFHQLALHTQVVKKKSEINYQHGRLLYAVLGKYLHEQKPDFMNIIETGTARGFSALCMAKALFDSKTCGKIITFDVLPHLHKMYWNCIDDLEGKKTRAEILNAYKDLMDKYILFHQGDTITELPKIQMERVHFAFFDGGHDYYHLMREFECIKHAQIKGDLIFFDDYTPDLFPGVAKAVNEICEKNFYTKKIITINEHRIYAIAEKQ
jgi:predicted O-methyltransferase YrrM